MIQNGYNVAQEHTSDPFCINRATDETPEAIVPIFESVEIDRSAVSSKSIIGAGQV